jgi:ABC-type tungstate transport system permease subunit
MTENQQACRYFLATSGVKLPLKLVNEIEAGALSNRNTYIRASYDASGLLLKFEKMVYGDVEMSHSYSYDEFGVLRRAEILMLDEDPTVLEFNGAPA